MQSKKTIRDISVAIAGAGAVGSHDGLMLTRADVGALTVMDMDRYEDKNVTKTAGVIRFPEDVGTPKALTLARRLRAVSKPGQTVSALHGSLTRLGPLAYAGLDYVLLGLDNATAKLFVADALAALPEAQRPVLLSGGTHKDFAEALIYQPGGACLRCFIDPAQLADPNRRFSCAGPTYLQPGEEDPTDATGMAGVKAAMWSTELLRAHLDGALPAGVTLRVVQDRYPAMPRVTELMHRKSCPGCAARPVTDWTPLLGSALTLTLGQTFAALEAALGTSAFQLCVQRQLLGNFSYGEYVLRDRCRMCGAPASVYSHTSRIRAEQVLCESCRKKFGEIRGAHTFSDAERLHTFSPAHCPPELLEKTLYELGYNVGGFLEAGLPDGTLARFAPADDVGFLKRGRDQILPDYDAGPAAP